MVRGKLQARGTARLVLAALLLAACAPTSGSTTTDQSDADTALETGDTEVETDADAEPDVEPDGSHRPTQDTEPEPATPEPDPATASVSGELEVHYLDVGQGDATLLVHEDATVLIDAGRWQTSDVVPHLQARGVDALDLVVITHPHADHIGQFDQVLDAFEVAEVWWSGSETTTQTFERALSALERSDALYEEPRAGDTTQLGPLTIDVVNPPTGVNVADLHDAGIGLRITFGQVRFLFTGDAEAVTEGRMVAKSAATLAADILQLGHHGSSTSTTDPFLSAVDPSVAIYSAGAGNQYGHPHGVVLDRLDAAGVTTYGTDVHGSIVVATDGIGWTVRSEHDGEVVAAPPPGRDGGQAGTEPGRAGSTSSTGGAGTTDEEPAAADSGGCEPGQVDVNAASIDDLQRIIHIGPARARDLVELRPFPSVASLDRISGIGPARIDDITDQGVACVG